MKQKLQHFILLIFLSNLCFSQGELENHKKYWYYKSRLNNDFIKVGLGPGESIPFNERGDPYYPFDPNVADQLHAGDGSARLGIYLSVLATEYRLLKNNNQDVSRIKHEIFCALNAINRIDYNAEPIFNPGLAPNLNGFFMRDDIPPTFVSDNYNHFNYYNNNTPTNQLDDKGFTQTFTHGISVTESTGKKLASNAATAYGSSSFYEGDSFLKLSEESQDQVYYLLMGLTLTSKLVDAGETDAGSVFGYGSNGSNLVTEAKNISTRILTHISSDPLWRIKNPANIFSPNSNVQIGDDAIPYAYPLDNLGDFIKNNEALPFWYIPFVSGGTFWPHTTSADFRNLYSFSPAASTAWQLMGNMVQGITPDHHGFFNILAGTSNSVFHSFSVLDLGVQNAINALLVQIDDWVNQMLDQVQAVLDDLGGCGICNQLAQILIEAIQFSFNVLISVTQITINVLTQFLTPDVLVNSTDTQLLNNSLSSLVTYENTCVSPNMPLVHSGSDLYFGIYLREILHGYNDNLPSWLQWIGTPPVKAHNLVKNQVKSILDSAPCEGNYNFGSNFYSPPSPLGAWWGASCFIDRPDPLWKKTSCPSQAGEFSGLDYMLMHNLYYLTEGGNNPLYDLITRKVSYPLPFTLGSTGMFTQQNPGTIGAFEFIEAYNTIGSNGDATYRAGKSVHLIQGFNAGSGANFHAYVDPFNCSGVSDAMSRATQSGTQTGIYDGMTDVDQTKSVKPKKAISHQDNELMNNQNQIHDILSMQNDSIKKEIAKLKKQFVMPNKIEVYPNPNNGNFFIEFNLDEKDNVNIQISDPLGSIILQEKYIVGEMKLPISLEDYSKGVYFLKVKFSNGKEETRKITIQ